MSRKSNKQRLDVIRNAIQRDWGKQPYRIARLWGIGNKTLKFFDSRERCEGLRPKITFFAATIGKLKNKFQVTIETTLPRNGISPSRVLVKVGDDSTTKAQAIRAYNQLGTLGNRGTIAKNHHYHLFDGELDSYQEQPTL